MNPFDRISDEDVSFLFDIPDLDFPPFNFDTATDLKAQQVAQVQFPIITTPQSEAPDPLVLSELHVPVREKKPTKKRKKREPSKQALAAREYRRRKKKERENMAAELIKLKRENQKLRERVSQLESLLISQQFK